MRYLGIDYGSKRIGLAYSDEEGRIAMPHSVIKADRDSTDTILDLIKEKHIEAVILGESKDLSGHDNAVMKIIMPFKAELEERGIKVLYEKEFFTSAHVEHKGELLDASAAALILQRYLDRHNHGNN